MFTRERRDRIVATVRDRGSASVGDLALALDASESTIRRDLDVLDRDGELTRTYGGAVLGPRATVEERGGAGVEGPFTLVPHAEEKQRIGRAAAGLVADGGVVVLDIGTTTAVLARQLRGRDLTVITSSLAVFDELRDDDAVRLVLLGGVHRRNYRTLVGSLTEHALTQVSADVVFLSCTGVRPNGHVVDNMAVEAPIKQSMIRASHRVVLLADESKFPGTGALRICGLDQVDVVVTTAGAPGTTLGHCRDAGGEVVIA